MCRQRLSCLWPDVERVWSGRCAENSNSLFPTTTNTRKPRRNSPASATCSKRKVRGNFTAVSGAALDEHRSLLGPARNTFHRLLSLEIEHRLNRGCEILEACLASLALSVGFGDFGANGHEPFAFMHHDSGILVLHTREFVLNPHSPGLDSRQSQLSDNGRQTGALM